MSHSHNDNNICFDCRKSVRIGWQCPSCGKDLIHISHHWRVPKRKDKKGWDKFRMLLVKRGSMGEPYTRMQIWRKTLKEV